MSDGIVVKFWGVRGGVPSPGPHSVRYGGNTACVEMRCGKSTLIFDAGTGLRRLGDVLARNKMRGGSLPDHLNLFLSHAHYDHICGLPFFAPLTDKNAKLSIWSGHQHGKGQTEKIVRDYMVEPFFPVSPDVFHATVDYHDFEAGEAIKPVEKVKVLTCPLVHGGGCVGYRVEYAGKSACYITDTSHDPDMQDPVLAGFVQDADLVIYDGTFTDREFPTYRNHDHSTWQEGLRLCESGGVKRYGIFHHLPARSDAQLDAIGKQAKKRFKGAFVAKEGLTVRL